MRFGIIGTNFITEWFLQAARQLPEFELEAVYSRSQQTGEAFAEKHGAKQVFTSLDALAACPEVDAVYVASPNALHCPQSIQMLTAGKHVLCEKAIASNSAELAAMLATAQQNGVVLMEGTRNIHSPVPDALREYLPRLGPVRRVAFGFHQYSSRYDRFKEGIIENAFNPAFSNGALMDIGVYCVQLLVALFGAPQSIVAKGILLPKSIDGQGFILAGYEGFLAEISYSKISECSAPNIIQGENGSLVLPHVARAKGFTWQPRGGEAQEITLNVADNNMVYELEHFIGYCNGNRAGLEFYHNCSIQSLQVMDEARRQQGIVFPADKT